MATGIVFDVRRYSIHDGPGIRTTVFLKGCPLRCAWCHNPESQHAQPELVFRDNRCMACGECVPACPQGAIHLNDHSTITDPALCRACGGCLPTCPTNARQIAGLPMTAEELLKTLERDLPFYDESRGGVTFSGGEPLRQPNFLLELLQGCREREIHTAVDTCGYAEWEIIDRLRPYIDLFLYDLKLMDSARHKAATGVGNEVILANLTRLANLGHEIHLRTPLIPGVSDGRDNITAICKLAVSLPGIRAVALLPYHEAAAQKYSRLGRAYPYPEARTQDDATLLRLANLVESFGLTVKIGG